MFISNKDIGNYGETLSCRYLTAKGYKILERNFRNRLGEIDIICIFKNILVFVEVKSRYTKNYGYPLEAVNYKKQRNIIRLAESYIKFKKLYNLNIRFDVIEIFFNSENDKFSVNHLPDAFRLY